METNIKVQLHARCLEIIADKISSINTELKSIEESRNNETKSSAGDKYETSREMMNMEADKSRAQLAKTNELRLLLQKINPENHTEEISLGSLVISKQGKYYISIPLGKVNLEDESYYCISMASPMGKLLRGKVVGESVDFNGRGVEVLGVL